MFRAAHATLDTSHLLASARGSATTATMQPRTLCAAQHTQPRSSSSAQSHPAACRTWPWSGLVRQAVKGAQPALVTCTPAPPKSAAVLTRPCSRLVRQVVKGAQRPRMVNASNDKRRQLAAGDELGRRLCSAPGAAAEGPAGGGGGNGVSLLVCRFPSHSSAASTPAQREPGCDSASHRGNGGTQRSRVQLQVRQPEAQSLRCVPSHPTAAPALTRPNNPHPHTPKRRPGTHSLSK